MCFPPWPLPLTYSQAPWPKIQVRGKETCDSSPYATSTILTMGTFIKIKVLNHIKTFSFHVHPILCPRLHDPVLTLPCQTQGEHKWVTCLGVGYFHSLKDSKNEPQRIAWYSDFFNIHSPSSRKQPLQFYLGGYHVPIPSPWSPGLGSKHSSSPKTTISLLYCWAISCRTGEWSQEFEQSVLGFSGFC